jgi:hypothetical protein
MKTKLVIFTATFSLIFILAPLVCAQDADKAAIDKYISAQAKHERGEEYPDARKVVTGDLNGDATAETVVLYTIEGQGGSNRHVQYLAVFKRVDGKLVPVTHTSVSANRDVELDSISNQLINLTTMSYGKNDPQCCPSIKGKAWYKLVGIALMPVRNRR